MGLLPGTRLGPYEVIAQIGVGGMGEVYRGIDTDLKRQVAIKVLPASVAADVQRLARFQREAEVLAALDHPNIAQIHGLEKRDGMTALVMELVEGLSLSDRIAQGAMSIDEALPIATQIAEALEAAHERGIIHRDLKPANVMVRPDGAVKVLDFGLAKATDSAAGTLPSLPTSPTITTPALTRAGMILGTAAYMAPEQARGKPLDKRADVWAFGCVLYEMLTGKRAFSGDEVADVLARVIEGDPDFSQLPRSTPPAVRRLIRRCLVKERRWRLPDLAIARIEIEDARTTSPEPLALSQNAGRRYAPFVWLGGAAVLAAVAALAAFTMAQRAPEPLVTRLEVTTPPTFDSSSFALSPDGRQLAFVANAEGRPQLWIRPLEDETARPIPGTNGASAPFWSPDSRSIGFFAESKLKTINWISGAAQVLADASSGRGGTWNRDDVIVFAPETNNVGLMRVAATGGTPTAVTRLGTGHSSHRWPQFLPDGRRFLFWSGQGEPSVTGVYLASLDGGEPRRLLVADTAAVFVPPGYLLRVSHGVLLAHRFDPTRVEVSDEGVPVALSVGTREGAFRGLFSVSDTGILAHRVGTGARRQLTWVNGSGETTGLVGAPDDLVPSAPELSSDGRRVVLMRGTQNAADVWIVDTDRGVPSKLTFGGGNLPIWSAGADRVFFSLRNELFEKPSNGVGDERPLVPLRDTGIQTGNVHRVPQDVSRDGRYLLYAEGLDLWALPLTGERTPVGVATSSEFYEGQGQFSPDGKWIAYVSNQNETARPQIFVRPFPGPGVKLQVSADGGIYPRWRPDGREIFYVAPNGQLMAVPIQTASVEPVPGKPVALFQTKLATGAYILSSGVSARAQYDVARDGRFLMNNSVEEAAPPIKIILNWMTLVSR